MEEEKRSTKKPASSSKIYLQRQINNTTGQKGSGPGQFNCPWGVAFDWTKQQLVISEYGGLRLQFIDSEDMKHLRTVGAKGENLNRFFEPTGLTQQPITNNLLVCDRGNRCIQMLNDQDEVVAVIGGSKQESTRDGQFHDVGEIACAPSGHFFATDEGNRRVQVFDASGRFMDKFGDTDDLDEYPEPLALSVLDRRFSPSSTASSMLLVSDRWSHRLNAWPLDGSKKMISSTKLCSDAPGICVDLNGFVCVTTESHTIQVLDPRREFACLQTIKPVTSLAQNQCNYLAGICVNHINTLIVVDCGYDRLQFFV